MALHPYIRSVRVNEMGGLEVLVLDRQDPAWKRLIELSPIDLVRFEQFARSVRRVARELL